ncbi:MAG: type II 3-dehydroquinate dehydratase [Candidatus Levybacteria bacterium]|nr:type II 3-dehydroquinate dehydratase [Candidatus Levybacteria bacterium]
MKILILNGPNLNILGNRDKNHYGIKSLDEINAELENHAQKYKVELLFFQSNHEGELIDFLQKESKHADGVLINPGALTHYGYSLRDALVDTDLPIVEVHLSNIKKREEFRKTDVLDGIVIKRIMGLKEKGYIIGLEKLVEHIRKTS